MIYKTPIALDFNPQAIKAHGHPHPNQALYKE